ncbi:MAG: hypothetical protein R6W97_08615 [Thiobacillus sp.]
MTKLTNEIKRMLNALAYANAGENLTLRQKAGHLNKSSGAAIEAAAPAPAQPATGRRQQVALYMGSELPEDMMQYVLQTCARLNHGLTVLTFQSESSARALLSPYMDAFESAGISMKQVQLSGDPVSGLARYLSRHSEVAFLACNETGYLGRSFLNGTQRQDVLPVPVVMVAPHDKALPIGQKLSSESVPQTRAA